MKDTSLRVPPGVEGIVIDAKVFSRRGVDKDQRSLAIEHEETARLGKDLRDDEIEVLGRSARAKLREILLTEITEDESAAIKDTGRPLLLNVRRAIKRMILTGFRIEAWTGADLKSTYGYSLNGWNLL